MSVERTASERIRSTEIEGGEVVTVRSDDPFLLRPYQIYLVTNSACGHIRHFTSEVAALDYHENLVAVMMKEKKPNK